MAFGRGEGGGARCEAAGLKKPRMYSLKYSEDIFGPTTTRMVADRSPAMKSGKSASAKPPGYAGGSIPDLSRHETPSPHRCASM